MQLQGHVYLAGTPQEIWPVLFEPDVIGSVIPGCRAVRMVAPDLYAGTIDLRLGFFSQSFDTRFAITEHVYPDGYRLEIDAQGSGMEVNVVTHVALMALGARETRMSYDSTARLSGALSAFGPLGESLARSLVEQGMENLRRTIERRVDGTESGGDAAG